ncbi:crooked neck protein, putative [Medicago truncatula]|uniref:Crooked neck protein, putative n=1 Tax=Medicago truncatula TaxID=3880 RepID=G7L6K1_MEDTR|nr:crooked neck protein, putative [Medicago truncatula]
MSQTLQSKRFNTVVDQFGLHNSNWLRMWIMAWDNKNSQKQIGKGIKDAIVGKRRFQSKDESVRNKETTKEVYERAVANVPPAEPKTSENKSITWQPIFYHHSAFIPSNPEI